MYQRERERGREGREREITYAIPPFIVFGQAVCVSTFGM